MIINATKIMLYSLLLFSLTLVGLSPSYALTFSEAQKLFSSEDNAVIDFGRTVSISADTAVIGASGIDGIGFANVFVRDSTGVCEKLGIVDGVPDKLVGSSNSVSLVPYIQVRFDIGNVPSVLLRQV